MKVLLRFSSIVIIISGFVLLIGGLWGIGFTYQSVSREKIVTPDDAAIPNAPVVEPMTLKAQSDIIRKHALEMTDGKTYAEMPRQVEKVDENGNPVLDDEGNPVLVPNEARNTWITVTALTTALNLGILTYGFSAATALIGFVFILIGFNFYKFNTKGKIAR